MEEARGLLAWVGLRRKRAVNDASVALGGDREQRAQQQVADVGEDVGAARRDAVLANKPVEAAQRIVNALSRLEVLGIPSARAMPAFRKNSLQTYNRADGRLFSTLWD